MKVRVLVGLLIGFVIASAGLTLAGQETHGFVHKTYKGPEGEGKYQVFVPYKYTGAKALPLILFLHGAGETGSDGEKQVKVGLAPAIVKREKDFPFIAVFPQSQKKSWKAGTPDADRALAILAEVQKSSKVDSKRIYLTGLSMGGTGTWSLAAAHPDRWAAIAPLCGRSDLSTAEKIKDIPTWSVCGDQDKKDLVENNREIFKALKGAGGSPRYDEYKGVGHNCWDQAYANQDLYKWFLSHKLK